MANKSAARDELQALEMLAKTEEQLRQYFKLSGLYNLTTASAGYWTPSYSWNDPVGFVVTGPGTNGIVV